MINLKDINEPKDLNNLTVPELKDLAVQIREFLLEEVSKTGGHLSSNLGVVELTLALHQVFDSPTDKLIWDVGHQGYVHKILTGRQGGFATLRKFEGMSGFLKASESEHDVFGAGHSSTSISAALGYAKAMRLRGENNKAVAIIGDGALTGGLAFEALNYAGHSQENIIVVLNDNDMSISDNVGAISTYLNKARTTKTYYHLKLKVNRFLKKIPVIGQPLINFALNLKNSLKQFVVKGMLFEEFGFTYVGVVDGHNIRKLIDVFNHVKGIDGPIFIHVATKKGKGYQPAEDKPGQYHGVSKFNVKEGIIIKKGLAKYQDVFGSQIVKMAKADDRVVAITAAMPTGTGLDQFAKEIPERFVDVGIAEQHAVTMAAGLAKGGMKPYIAVYSTFLQRAYDQIIHDVCLQNLDVVLCIDRAGLVGEDGETHHGMFDLSYLSHIPNMTVLAPKDGHELVEMLKYSLHHQGPLAIRYPRGVAVDINQQDIEDNKAELLFSGKDGVIIAVGKMVSVGCDVINLLKKDGLEFSLINPRQLFPLHQSMLSLLEGQENIFTIEDNVIIGGYGAYLSTVLNQKIVPYALSLSFIEHGNVDRLLEKESLTAIQIAQNIKIELGK